MCFARSADDCVLISFAVRPRDGGEVLHINQLVNGLVNPLLRPAGQIA